MVEARSVNVKTTTSTTRTFVAYQSTQWLKRKTPNVLSVVPAWARTHEAKVSPRTLGGRVAEESRLVIAAALPTALISYSSVVAVAIPPTKSNIFLHYQQKLTTPCTSLPPSELTQLQALCGTEHRAFVPPIDLNRPDVVSLKRGRPIIRRVAKTIYRSHLTSGVQHPARSLTVIVIIDQFGVLGHATTSMYLVRRVRTTHIYDFLFMAFEQNLMSCRSYYL